MASETEHSDQQVIKTLEQGAKRVTELDIKRVLEQSDTISRKFEKKGFHKRLLEDAKLLLAVIHDYWRGNYRQIPYWTIAAIASALLYVLNPLDFIPDAIPLRGQLDDAAVVAACLALVESDLRKYREWKQKNSE